jgi:hypothetical protein
MIEVIAVKPTQGYHLVVTFNTGEVRHFDMRPYLRYPIYQRLENPGFFALAKVNYGTVTWPGDIDIAPETIYHDGLPETQSSV